MKIELPSQNNHNNHNNQQPKKNITKKSNKRHKKGGTTWRDNGDTISTKINSDVIFIEKRTFNIQLNNGFIIKCKSMEDAKSKTILLFKK